MAAQMSAAMMAARVRIRKRWHQSHQTCGAFSGALESCASLPRISSARADMCTDCADGCQLIFASLRVRVYVCVCVCGCVCVNVGGIWSHSDLNGVVRRYVGRSGARDDGREGGRGRNTRVWTFQLGETSLAVRESSKDCTAIGHSVGHGTVSPTDST